MVIERLFDKLKITNLQEIFKSIHSIDILMLDVPILLMIIPSGIEWIIIAAVIVAAIFGAKKIPELARSFGRASGEYQKARIEAKKELEQLKGGAIAARSKLEEIAKDLGIDYRNKNVDELRADIQKEINNK
jgi:sec-independent protein translocase protein TatA